MSELKRPKLEDFNDPNISLTSQTLNYASALNIYCEALGTEVDKARINELRDLFDDIKDWDKLNVDKAEIKRLQAEIQSLMPFVDHAVTCGKKEGLDYCTCGLNEILIRNP